MYGLLLAVVPAPVALGATILNRLAITIVEAALLLLGAILWRTTRPTRGVDDGRPVPAVESPSTPTG
jgi:hypothetical protein